MYYSSELTNSIRGIVKLACKNQGFRQYELILNWPKIVGSRLSEITQPQKITSYKKGETVFRTLHIDANDSGIAFEVMMIKNMLIEKISSFFGYNYIQDIKVIQKFMQKEVEEKVKVKSQNLITDSSLLDQIEDDDLKKALENLGRS